MAKSTRMTHTGSRAFGGTVTVMSQNIEVAKHKPGLPKQTKPHSYGAETDFLLSAEQTHQESFADRSCPDAAKGTHILSRVEGAYDLNSRG